MQEEDQQDDAAEISAALGVTFQSSFARALAQASVRRGHSKHELQIATIRGREDEDHSQALCNGGNDTTWNSQALCNGGNDATWNSQALCNGGNDATWQLKEECQRLLEENRRLRATAMLAPLHDDHEQRAEITLLKKRVHTLSWQLSQSESNRRVLKTVSDQVVNFLDRVSAAMVSLDSQRSPPRSGGRVPRSRSTHEPRRLDVSSSDTSTPTLPVTREFVPRSSLLRSGSDVHRGDNSASGPSWRRNRTSPLEEESANPGRLGQQARRLARTMRSLLSTQEHDLKPAVTSAPPPDVSPDSALLLDPYSPGNILRSSRRRLSYENQDQRRASFLRKLTDHHHVSFHQETTTTMLAATPTSADSSSSSNKTSSDLAVYLTPALSIASSSDSSSPSTSPTRKQEAEESGFSSLGSFQEIGLPPYQQNGLPSINHARCRSTPVATKTTTHSYYRTSENTAEIATLEKLKVLWV